MSPRTSFLSPGTQINYSEEEDTPEGLIRFGAVGAAEVKADDDIIIVIAPQSMGIPAGTQPPLPRPIAMHPYLRGRALESLLVAVGASIYESLSAMTERATEVDAQR